MLYIEQLPGCKFHIKDIDFWEEFCRVLLGRDGVDVLRAQLIERQFNFIKICSFYKFYQNVVVLKIKGAIWKFMEKDGKKLASV